MRAMKRGEIRIIVRFSAAVPLWRVALYGLVLFVVSFCVGRYTRDFTRQSSKVAVEERAANLASTIAASPSAQKTAPPGVVQVTIRGMQYEPARVEIKSGGTVEWKNDDITPHTVTCASFDSGSIGPDESWRHTFTSADEINYACTFHPGMKGVILVR
jgi:plastocyanin